MCNLILALCLCRTVHWRWELQIEEFNQSDNFNINLILISWIFVLNSQFSDYALKIEIEDWKIEIWLIKTKISLS